MCIMPPRPKCATACAPMLGIGKRKSDIGKHVGCLKAKTFLLTELFPKRESLFYEKACACFERENKLCWTGSMFTRPAEKLDSRNKSGIENGSLPLVPFGPFVY